MDHATDHNQAKRWFAKRQKSLLELANTEAGRWLLGADPKEEIANLTPNGYHVFLGRGRGGMPHYVARFNTWDRVAGIFIPVIEKMEIANAEYRRISNRREAFLHFTGLEEKKYKYPQIYLSTSTFTANGGGQGRIYVASTVYSTAHNATSGTKDNGGFRPEHNLNGANYEEHRGFAPFDSSSLPNNATIVSGVNTFVRAVGAAGTSNADSDSVSLVQSTQASNTALVGDDFDQVGSTKFATDIAIASWNTSGNNDFQLNASGIANISLTGYSLFAWRTAKDISNTIPTGNNYVNMGDNTNLLSVEYTGPSPSLSPSASPSPSPSLSPSASLSPSSSSSQSPSSSPSASQSPSSSVSPSPSLSPSASPSIGYSQYTRGDYAALPANDNDLETTYTAQDETDVSTKNDVRVGQSATSQYAIHQYKDFVGSNTSCQVEWEGQSTLAPSASTVYLQIYNRNTTTWDTIDSDSTSSADTDFTLIAEVANLTNYKDESNVISCRVQQLSTP